MKTSTALKAASIVTLLFALGHTLGGRSSWSPIGETPTLAAMRAFHMGVNGAKRSYYDFFMGFGYTLSVFMVLEAVLLWLIAGLAKSQLKATRPIIGAFFVASVLNAFLTWAYIFPLPAAFSLLQTALLGLALFLSARELRTAASSRILGP